MDKKPFQRYWSSSVHEALFRSLKSDAPPSELAHIMTATQSHSGDLITAYPIDQVRTQLDDTAPSDRCCSSGRPQHLPSTPVSMWGYCPIRWPSSTFVSFQRWPISPTRRNQKHHHKITGYRCPSLHSRTGRSRSGRRQKTRWSDVFSFKGCKSLAWDTTFPDLYSASNLYSTILNRGSASSAAVDLKRLIYSQFVEDIEFVPVTVETSGIIGSVGCSILTAIDRRISIPVLHISTNFSRHHSGQRAVYVVLIKELCPEISNLTISKQ